MIARNDMGPPTPQSSLLDPSLIFPTPHITEVDVSSVDRVHPWKPQRRKLVQ